MISLDLEIELINGDVEMLVTTSGIDTDTRLTFFYRESLLGEWEEVEQKTITEDDTYTATVGDLECGTYSFKCSIRQPPTGPPQLQLDSNIIAYVCEEGEEIIEINGYTTVDRVQSYLDIEADEAIRAITSATKWVEKYTNRQFISSNGTRYYSGYGKRSLFVDDCLSIGQLEIGLDRFGETTKIISAEDYVTIPRNGKEPIRKILLKNNWFTRGTQNHALTATFGYSELPPEDIIEATTRLAVMFAGTGKSGQITGKNSESIGDYSISYGQGEKEQEINQIKAILDNYTDIHL